MNFSQNFKSRFFVAVCSVAVLSTSATYAATCNDGVKYAIGGYRMSFQQSRCKLSYKPSACQALSAEQVLNETTVAPFLSFSVDGNEISYYTGNGNNADGTLLARPNSMSPMKFDPATYTFDLNSLGGKSAQFSSSKSLDLAFAAGNMETNKRMAINLKFDNIQSYCSDSGSSECKLNVSFLPLYLYNGKSLQQRGNPLFICLQDINIVKGVDIRASLEPTTQQYACNHQIKSGNFYTITNRTDSAKFTITLNKSQISQDFALIYDVVGNNADGLTAFPWKLEYSEQACFVPQKPNTPPPTPAIEHNSTFNFSPRIIEKRSFGYIMGGKLAGNLSVAWSAQGSTKNTLSTDQREIISITLKDGNGKDAPWASKIGWIFHPHIMANLYTGKCKAEWITTGDEFDGVGTFNVSNKTRYIMKALHGRDLDDPSSDVAGSGSNPELNALYNEVHEKYQNILKGCSNSFGEMRVGIDDDGGFHSHMSYSLFDFRVKNAPGINYENMEISVTYMNGNKKVTEKAVFTARPDRIVLADKDRTFPNAKSTNAYRVDCEGGKDCFNTNIYPISGLEYKINKSSNTGYQKTNPLPLEHNLVAVDINGKIVDTYTKTIPATIVNASNNIVINGIKHNLGNTNVGVEAVFENGVGYIRTPGKDYFKYDKSGHTFVQIIDNSVSGDCLAGKFNNTFWETYGYGVDDMMIRPIGCDTVLIPKPQSVAKAARTIFQRNYNRFNNVYGFGKNDFDTSNSAESSGDFWYIFSPTSIRVSHTNSDYFPNMTYYDDLTDGSDVSFLDANGSTNNKRKRQNLVYANLDLNITAYNGDGSIAGAYTSGQFETLSSRPYDKRFPNRNKPRQ
nr:hypothetical protein [Campylobacter sp.]